MVKFSVEGVLNVSGRDGKTYGRISYMGGALNVMLGRKITVVDGDQIQGTFFGEVRQGQKGAYFLLEEIK